MARKRSVALNASGALEGVGRQVNVVQEPLRKGTKEKRHAPAVIAGKASGKTLDMPAVDVEAAHGNKRFRAKPKKKPAHVKASY